MVDLEMCRNLNSLHSEYSHGTEIIQIGAVLLDEEYQIVRRFNCYVRPQYGNIDSFIKGLTGISWDDVKNAPLLEEALWQFIDWLPEEKVTAVSWSKSDEKQLRAEMSEKNIVIERMEDILDRWLDCQPIFTKRLGGRKRYSLGEALVAADIDTKGNAHNGMSDAYNTALLFSKMMRNPDFELNPYYKAAQEPEKGPGLQFSMGDLLKGIKLPGGGD